MDDLKFKVLLNDKTEKEFFILHTFKDNDLNVVIYTDDSSNYYANYYKIDNGNIKFLDKDVSQELVLKKVEEIINNGE